MKFNKTDTVMCDAQDIAIPVMKFSSSIFDKLSLQCAKCSSTITHTTKEFQGNIYLKETQQFCVSRRPYFIWILTVSARPKKLRYTLPSLPYHIPVQYHKLIVLYVTTISKVVIVVFLKTTINVRLGQYSRNCCFQKNNNYDFDIVVTYSTIRLWYYTGLWYGRLGGVYLNTVLTIFRLKEGGKLLYTYVQCFQRKVF